MAAGNHFLYPSGKQRVHYVNKRFSELHLNPRSSCNKIGSPCVTFDILALISLVALFMKRLTGRKEFGVMTSSEHKITEFSMVFFCMFNRYMPTFYSRKLHRDLCILLDQEMLKLIFTNTLKHFPCRAAHSYKISYVQTTAKFTNTRKKSDLSWSRKSWLMRYNVNLKIY